MNCRSFLIICLFISLTFFCQAKFANSMKKAQGQLRPLKPVFDRGDIGYDCSDRESSYDSDSDSSQVPDAMESSAQVCQTLRKCTLTARPGMRNKIKVCTNQIVCR